MNVHRLAIFDDAAATRLQDAVRDYRGYRRAVFYVTLFLWVSNYAVLNIRDYVSVRGLESSIAAMRVGVVILGCGLCYLIHLVISNMKGKSFRQRAIAVIILTPIAADIFAWLHTFGCWLVASEPTTTPISGVIFSLGYYIWFFMAWSAFYLALIYSEEAREQERRAAAIQAHAHAAQLRALRFQVNPHFLFNTLNSIAALIVDKHNGQAEQMVTRLAALATAGTAALQSSAAASTRRSGKRAMASVNARSLAQAAVRRASAAAVAMNVFVAATLSSGPAQIGKTKSHASASGESVTLTTATVMAPASLALFVKATRSSLRPDCEMASTN